MSGATSVGRALVLVWLLPISVAAAPSRIDILGSVYCRPAKDDPETPAWNVFVVVRSPDTGHTFSETDGHYRIVGLRYRYVVDRNVLLRYYASGNPVTGQTAFVSRERISKRDDIPVFTVPTVEIVADCSNIKPIGVEHEVPNFLSDVAVAGGAGAAAAGIVGLVIAAKKAAAPGPVVIEHLPIEAVSPPHPKSGGLLSNGRTLDFSAVGFRYAAARDMPSVIITNPAPAAFEDGWALAGGTRLPVGVFRIAATFTNGSGLASGIGYYHQTNSDDRQIAYDNGKMLNAAFDSSDHALVGFVAHRIGSRLSGSLSIKAQLQRIEQPDFVERSHFDDGTISDQVVKRDETKTATDVALGLSFQATPFVRLGLAASNLLGSSELLKDINVTDRVVGAGICWFKGRLHLGADIEHSGIRKLNASFGASFVERHDVEFGGGYLTTENTLRLRTRVKIVDYSVRWSTASGWNHYLGAFAKF